MYVEKIRKELKRKSSKKHAETLRWFFKTGPGEYGEGDVFIGVKVPEMRRVAKKYLGISLKETAGLLRSEVHEERMTSLLILVLKFEKAARRDRERIYKTYMKHVGYINNWDLVDLSAYRIVGAYLEDKDRKPLYELARSKNLWKRRIAIVSTYQYIRNNDLKDTLAISGMLIKDKEDLIHKAVGWMLREAGKKDAGLEEKFLKTCYKNMPRTMLRYAIERFPETKRQKYLKGII